VREVTLCASAPSGTIAGMPTRTHTDHPAGGGLVIELAGRRRTRRPAAHVMRRPGLLADVVPFPLRRSPDDAA
jgi:hypothetical protein